MCMVLPPLRNLHLVSHLIPSPEADDSSVADGFVSTISPSTGSTPIEAAGDHNSPTRAAPKITHTSRSIRADPASGRMPDGLGPMVAMRMAAPGIFRPRTTPTDKGTIP